jgi:hypothetical protein
MTWSVFHDLSKSLSTGRTELAGLDAQSYELQKKELEEKRGTHPLFDVVFLHTGMV